MDKQELVLENNNLTATISLRGAELLSFKKDNKEFIWNGESFWKGHAPILFPVCGGLINGKYYYNDVGHEMTKHGFIRFQHFNVVEQTKNKVVLCFEDNKKTFKCFPFHFKFFVTYELGDELNIKYEIVNLSKEEMYFNVGSHEGYFLHDAFENYYVKFDKDEKLYTLLLDSSLLSHDKMDLTKLGNCVPLNYNDYQDDNSLIFENLKSRKATICHKKSGDMLDICFPDANNVIMWSIPNSGFICIEPWNGLPDYVDSKLDIKNKKSVKILLSGQTFKFVHSIRIR